MGVAVAKNGTAPKLPNRHERGSDTFSHPLGEKQASLKQAAQEMAVTGEKRPRGDNHVVKVAKGQFVELAQTGTDHIWTVTGEFADLDHNQIPEPDRTVDNTTKWEPNFSRDYYLDMLFDTGRGQNSMANYYLEQSSGAYTVTG
ncbi:MAG TPA: immune inhibitor A domain-containing protein, partial [Mycobacterium sp.]|nr:immune inhibitor A domain-containing protein [Mycobacterium sp.]